MTRSDVRGRVYRCPICGAEISVVAVCHGDFHPRCCNVPMEPLPGHLAFFICPVCGAEIAVIRESEGTFLPRCCNTAMRREAA